MAYFLFPLPDVCRVLGYLPKFERLTIDPYSRILIEIQLPEFGGVAYYFDFNLKLVEYRFSDNFAPLHDRLCRQGLLDHLLGDEEKASLRKVIPFPAAPDGNSPALEQFWKF